MPSRNNAAKPAKSGAPGSRAAVPIMVMGSGCMTPLLLIRRGMLASGALSYRRGHYGLRNRID